MQTKEQVLQACTIDGTTVKLPAVQLDRKLYLEVAEALELIGGKWKGGKIMGFVFPENPEELLDQIANGEKRNLKKEFQFFATPPELADLLVSLADIKTGQRILEPSAGQGAIIKAINRQIPQKLVQAFEVMPINRTFLEKIERCELIGDDFLKIKQYEKFDRIIANPPFSKNQDIDHIIQMYLSTKVGGRIVSIASKHWQFAQEKKCEQFREWLTEIGADIQEVDRGAFKDSGTMIEACIIIINK